MLKHNVFSSNAKILNREKCTVWNRHSNILSLFLCYILIDNIHKITPKWIPQNIIFFINWTFFNTILVAVLYMFPENFMGFQILQKHIFTSLITSGVREILFFLFRMLMSFWYSILWHFKVAHFKAICIEKWFYIQFW